MEASEPPLTISLLAQSPQRHPCRGGEPSSFTPGSAVLRWEGVSTMAGDRKENQAAGPSGFTQLHVSARVCSTES